MHPAWLDNYPQNIPKTINPDEFHSLVDLYRRCFKRFGSRVAFSNFGTTLTYEELNRHSHAVAAYMTQVLKLKKGDRVAIMLPNLLQYPVILFGLLQAGMIIVNINPLYTSHELTHVINDSGTKAIFILANFAHVLEAALPNIKIQHAIVTEIGDMFSPVKRVIYNFVTKYVKRLVKPWNITISISFRTLLQEGRKLSFTSSYIDSEETAFLQYTGGTTGVAKGAMLTHRNIIANILQLSAWIKTKNRKDNEEVVITPLPLYHIFSLTVNCLTFTALGGHNVLITNPRDISAFIHTIKKYKFTAISGVNTLYNAIMAHPDFNLVDFSHVHFAVAGGMALQRIVAERWQELTGSVLIDGYGLTEASPVVAANPLDIMGFTGSVGLPMPSTDLSIRDEDGQELSFGEEGELWVRGPQIMAGYWNNSAETDKVLTKDGWLKTGDVARIDSRGFIYIVDRKKDMIIVSGFNVYPNEVEDVIARHPGVREVAVIGVPDSLSGEKVKAFIVRSDALLTEEDIISFCHQFLTRYKIPHLIEFRDELPKTNVGKILRRALRE